MATQEHKHFNEPKAECYGHILLHAWARVSEELVVLFLFSYLYEYVHAHACATCHARAHRTSALPGTASLNSLDESISSELAII
jgi:hypothetical protein